MESVYNLLDIPPCRRRKKKKKTSLYFDTKNSTAFRRFLFRCCPWFYFLLFGPRTAHLGWKVIACFIYGFCLGLCFYEFILVDMEFNMLWTFTLGLAICLLLAFGNASSIQIRCICALTFPSMCGIAGRGVLKAVILAMVLSGPIQNLIANMREVVRIYSCTSTLTSEMAKTRYNLMVKPFQKALLSMKGNVREVKETMRSVRGIVAPISEEMLGEEEMRKFQEENDYLDELQGETKRSDDIIKRYKSKKNDTQAQLYEKKYRRKVAHRCEDVITKGGERCRVMFANAYNKCYDKVSWIAAWLLCWPMKLTFVCNIVEAMGGEKRCNPGEAVEPGVGKAYESLVRTKKTLGKGFKEARFQYELPKKPDLTDLRTAADSARAISEDFRRREAVLNTLLKIIKRALAFVFIRIILSAQEYHDKYRSDIQWDNVYITKYFRKIDARRHRSGHHTLLPLRKIEKKVLVNPRSMKPAKSESTRLMHQSIRLLIELFTATTFIILDRLVYETLLLVRRHANVEFVQEGSHDLILTVKGTGFIASIVRSLLKGFNIKQRVKKTTNNKECLPNPHLLPNSFLFKIYGMHLAIFLLVLLEAFTQRMRRAICAYFYPKREKQRVLFLYNESLKRRRTLFKFMLIKIKRMVREQRLELQANPLLTLRLQWPQKFGWLRFLPFARRHCPICDEKESGNRKDTFKGCPLPDCPFYYCRECWTDLGERCYVCDPPDESEEPPEDDENEILYIDN